MLEVIREGSIWLTGWILDREPQGGEAFRLLCLVLFSGLATWSILHWRDLALRFPSVRKRLLPEERYAGRYLQAASRKDGIRYAILDVYYNPRQRRFEVFGRNYSPAGEQLSSFKSSHILFPSVKDENIEFIWQGSKSASGHTLMRVEIVDADYIEGDGRIQTFSANPEILPILFKLLHEGHVRQALGVGPPSSAAEEPDFIRSFHEKLGGAVLAGFSNVAEEV
jgi:hypothetical protein